MALKTPVRAPTRHAGRVSDAPVSDAPVSDAPARAPARHAGRVSDKTLAIVFVCVLVFILALTGALWALAVLLHTRGGDYKTSAGYCLSRNKPADCLSAQPWE